MVHSGAFNTHLLHSSLGGSPRRNWLYFNYAKLATGLVIFSPVFALLPLSKSARVDVQFYWVVGALVLSPMARYYREKSVKASRREKVA